MIRASRRPYHFRRAEFGLVLGLDAVGLQHLDNHRTEQGALRVEQRPHADDGTFGDGDSGGGLLRGLFATAAGKDGRQCQGQDYRHDHCSRSSHRFTFLNRSASLSCPHSAAGVNPRAPGFYVKGRIGC